MEGVNVYLRYFLKEKQQNKNISFISRVFLYIFKQVCLGPHRNMGFSSQTMKETMNLCGKIEITCFFFLLLLVSDVLII